MRASRAALSLVLLSLVGCPPGGAPAPAPSAAPSPATPPAPAVSPEPTDVGNVPLGALDVAVVDERGRPVEGAVVWLAGVKPRTPVPSEPVLLDQKDLAFVPAFLVARKGQTLHVHNADGELHNVHSAAECCRWNASIVAGKDDSRVLDATGEATLLCDIHSNMRCVLRVLDADFARTGADGHARLDAPSGVQKLRVAALDRPEDRREVTIASALTSVTVTLGALEKAPIVEAPERLPWPVVAARLGASLARAEHWAECGDGASAREAADEAVGRWYSGSGLYEAVRELDAAAVERGDKAAKGRADELKSRLKKSATKAEAAGKAEAGARGAALDDLRAHDKAVATEIGELARALPAREKK